MPPTAKLIPLPAEVQVPLSVGERVALHDDHPEHPGMYGVIVDLGADPADNTLKLDLRLFDPFTGPTGDNTAIYRATMGDIQ